MNNQPQAQTPVQAQSQTTNSNRAVHRLRYWPAGVQKSKDTATIVKFTRWSKCMSEAKKQLNAGARVEITQKSQTLN